MKQFYHLDTCLVDLAISFNATHCYYYYTETTTAFYQSDVLQLPFWFGALCFSMSIFGITILLLPWQQSSKYWRYYAYLEVSQGLASFCSDYINAKADSSTAPIDRILATFSAVGFLFGLLTTRGPELPYLRCTALAASFCMYNSQRAQFIVDAERYIFWHSLWHTAPLVSSLILIVFQYKQNKGMLKKGTAAVYPGKDKREEVGAAQCV